MGIQIAAILQAPAQGMLRTGDAFRLPLSSGAGKDRLRNPNYATLNVSTTDGNSQHRLAELLHRASTAALTSTPLANEPAKPWPVSSLKTLRRRPLADPSAGRALPLMQNEMGDLYLDFGKLDC